MSRACIKSILRSSSTPRLLYANKNTLFENRTKNSNIIFPLSTLSSKSVYGLHERINDIICIAQTDIGKCAFSTNKTNNEITSHEHIENDVKTLDEKITSPSEDETSNVKEPITDEERMTKLLKNIKKRAPIDIAATKLINLLRTVPPEVIKPCFHKANINLHKTHALGKQSNVKVEDDENHDPFETLEEKSEKSDHEVEKMSNTNESAILHILYSLSSENVKHLNTQTMISILKLLSEKLQIEENESFTVRNIENCLTWKSREIPISDLCILLSFSHKRKTASNNNNFAVSLFEETLKNAERRWVEVVNAKDFHNLVYYYPNYVSEQFMRKLESRITDFIETMDAADLVMVLKTLGMKKRRHMPLLKAISYHLIKRRNELDIKALSDCLFAMNQLSFKDNSLLDAMCDSINQKLISSDSDGLLNITEEQQIMLARSILTSLGQLKFLNTGLLDNLCMMLSSKIVDNTNNDKSILKSKDYASFLMTTSTLNYCPKNSDALYEAVIQNLMADNFENTNTRKETAKEVMWLNIVWSMTILNKAPHKCWASVLTTEFYNRLLYNHDNRNFQVILKLLNVNAAAKNDTSYKGPRIDVSDDPLLKDVKTIPSKDKLIFIEKAMEDFSNFASPPTNLVPNINTLMGFQIEGEAVFDKNGKSIPISGLSILDQNSNSKKVSKKLPENSTRVAIMCVGFHDCLADGSTLSGATSLNLRLLESKTKVFIIKHNYCGPRQKELERVTVLDSALKKLLSISK